MSLKHLPKFNSDLCSHTVLNDTFPFPCIVVSGHSTKEFFLAGSRPLNPLRQETGAAFKDVKFSKNYDQRMECECIKVFNNII